MLKLLILAVLVLLLLLVIFVSFPEKGRSSTEPRNGNRFRDIWHKGHYDSKVIPHAELRYEKAVIGKGFSGCVYKGLWVKPGRQAECVAIKTINKNPKNDPENDVRSLFKEYGVMATCNHPNVLKVYGMCLDSPDGTPLMVLPYMVNGSLLDYLKRPQLLHQPGNQFLLKRSNILHFQQRLEEADMIRMCTDIARGMSYLAAMGIVHRDLAARNCLLDDNLCVKIGDFGLSRDIFMTNSYTASPNTPLPRKWMAPEMLRYRTSDEKTDVWAYAVTCWEVFSLGDTPYPDIDNDQVLELLMKRVRLDKPVLCTDKIYRLLRRCWSARPVERPRFSEILKEMEAFSSSYDGWII